MVYILCFFMAVLSVCMSVHPWWPEVSVGFPRAGDSVSHCVGAGNETQVRGESGQCA